MDVALGVQARDEDRLLLAELADSAGAVARADPGSLRAAHRQLQRNVVEHRVVDADGACLNALGDLLAASNVAREDRSTEPKLAVVGEADCLLGILDLHDRQSRPEGLLVHRRHRMVNVNEHRRLKEVAGAAAALTAGKNLGAAGNCLVDVPLNDVNLRREGHRADLNRAWAGANALA